MHALRSSLALLLLALALVGCGKSISWSENNRFSDEMTRRWPEFLKTLDPPSFPGLTRPQPTPGERAMTLVAPQVVHLRFHCDRSAWRRSRLEYTLRLHDGRTKTGSVLRTCSVQSEHVDVSFADPKRIVVQTSGEERASAFREDMGAHLLNDVRAAIQGGAWDLAQDGLQSPAPTPQQVQDSWK
ncbi:hypothetical protein [Chondromyces crocatus]|uniref:Lipoprotein n=1 Tax=Chondromyces crocatus TaxID=52 RepID=A0A0K1ET13_CHOCO|nr:hypothetical protein [Chondromyces crocatus]AKT43763.1 uncharacterized protein CMC5_079990 [Chondromyces crocatus]